MDMPFCMSLGTIQSEHKQSCIVLMAEGEGTLHGGTRHGRDVLLLSLSLAFMGCIEGPEWENALGTAILF